MPGSRCRPRNWCPGTSSACEITATGARTFFGKTAELVRTAGTLSACKLVFSLGVFLHGHYSLRLDTRSLQTLTFATLILSSQAGVYLLRERGHFWQSRPSRYLVGSSVLGLGVTTLLALGGILMPAISGWLLLGVAGAGAVGFAALDWVKVWLFERLELR